MNLGKFLALAGIGLLAAPFGACADTVPADTAHNPTPGTDISVMALRFEPIGETETSCGEAMGIRVTIADADGESQTCVAEWAPATISDPYTGVGDDGEHLVADCFFVVEPGLWSIQTVEVVGADDAALPCCEGEFPDLVTVEEGETTEFGVELNCDVVGSGGLDVYGYLNRPPIIVDLDIAPSKFARTCDVVTLTASADDPEGDTITYTWSVVAGPAGAGLAQLGDTAWFTGALVGEYTLNLEVSDNHGVSTDLNFPIHVTEVNGDCDVVDAIVDAAAEVGVELDAEVDVEISVEVDVDVD